MPLKVNESIIEYSKDRKMTLSVESFLQAFQEVWRQEQSKADSFSNRNPWEIVPRKLWTEYILSKENGLLSKMVPVFSPLDQNIAYTREWYTVDGLFIGGSELFREGSWGYPSSVYAIVEHELDENIEEETWKLAHWRCPLKVLFFYDWADNDKNTDTKSNFLPNKLSKMYSMIAEISKHWAENQDTQYLFIIGTRVDWYSPIVWKYCTYQDRIIKTLA
jgi:hypothetical protein